MKDSKILYIKYEITKYFLVWFMGIYFVFVFRVFFEIRGKEIVWDQNYCFLPWNSMFVIQRLNVFSNKCLSTMQSVNGFSSKRLSVYCLIVVHWSLGKSLKKVFSYWIPQQKMICNYKFLAKQLKNRYKNCSHINCFVYIHPWRYHTIV